MPAEFNPLVFAAEEPARLGLGLAFGDRRGNPTSKGRLPRAGRGGDAFAFPPSII